jgi:signal transduction histidine kinase
MRLRPRGTGRRWPRLPRRTARLRLTALYGGLFLACGAALLAVTYLLVEGAINPGNLNLSGLSQVKMPSGLSLFPAGAGPSPAGPKPSPAGHLNPLVVVLAKAIAAIDLRQVLIQAPIALAIVTVVALVLGWVVAGRILRPLATITAAARRISASNLNERLNLHGPADELKALGDTLDDLFARLEASFESQRHFVASASHELRTPITRERATLQVALDDPGTTTETWRSTTREVLASIAEQESLIEALLTLASSEGGLDQREPVDLAAVTDEVLLAHGHEIGRLGLQVQTSTEPAVFDGDPLLAERMVTNLIGNAVRHNVPGGCVEAATGSKHGRAALSVSNTGPVVPPTEVGRLFQPFQRLGGRRARNASGHGLGLSIVRAIAAAHGATINAHANHDGGLTITVTFPPFAPDRTSLAWSGAGQRSSPAATRSPERGR